MVRYLHGWTERRLPRQDIFNYSIIAVIIAPDIPLPAIIVPIIAATRVPARIIVAALKIFQGMRKKKKKRVIRRMPVEGVVGILILSLRLLIRVLLTLKTRRRMRMRMKRAYCSHHLPPLHSLQRVSFFFFPLPSMRSKLLFHSSSSSSPVSCTE